MKINHLEKLNLLLSKDNNKRVEAFSNFTQLDVENCVSQDTPATVAVAKALVQSNIDELTALGKTGLIVSINSIDFASPAEATMEIWKLIKLIRSFQINPSSVEIITEGYVKSVVDELINHLHTQSLFTKVINCKGAFTQEELDCASTILRKSRPAMNGLKVKVLNWVNDINIQPAVLKYVHKHLVIVNNVDVTLKGGN